VGVKEGIAFHKVDFLFAKISNENCILVCGLFFSLVLFLPVSHHVYGSTTTALTFDNATYFFDHSFVLTVTDPSAPPSPVKVHVGVPGTAGYDFPLQLVDPVNHIYQSPYINFTILYSSTNVMLNIGSTAPAAGSPITITATYPAGTTPTVTSSASVINTEYGTWPPTPISPQPLWGKVIADCSNYGNNQANDGVCDNWKIPAGQSNPGLQIPYLVADSTGSIPNGYYYLPCDPNASYDSTLAYTSPSGSNQWYDALGDLVCPDKAIADVYVQVDWMVGHKPDTNALIDVVDSFVHSPFKACSTCKSGIHLHIILGNQISIHKDTISTPIPGGSGATNPTDFDLIKQAHFALPADLKNVPSTWTYQENLTSKKQVFHYALFIHSQTGGEGSSGEAEQPGNDLIISLGSFTGDIGTTDQQEGTFMHELGHNLGLDHGGNVPDNCKPNYLSVMSYSRQFKELFPINRPLDYSHTSILGTLNENGITESSGVGISGPPNLQTVYGVNSGLIYKTTWAGNSAYQTLWLQLENNLADSSGNGVTVSPVFTGATKALSYVGGQVGTYSLKLDGTDYLTAPNSDATNLTGPWTLSAWINLSVINQQQGIIEKYDWTSAGGGYALRVGADNRIHAYVVEGTKVQGIASNTVLQQGKWYHVVATFDNAGTLSIYINGILDSTVSVSYTSWPSSATLKIGARGDNGAYSLNGLIDDVQIRNYALPAFDIQYIMNDQMSSSNTLWLQLENNLADSSGNANSVTPTSSSGGSATAVFSTGKIGSYSANLNGYYLTIPSSTSTNLTGPWTLSAWINPSVLNQQQGIIEKYDWTSAGGGYALRLGSDNRIYAYVVEGLTAQGVASNTVIAKIGDWTHVVATFDNAGTLSIYINGTLDSTTHFASTYTSWPSSATLKIGARGDNGAYSLNGLIDDVQIRNYVLSPSDISLFPEGQAPIDANGNGIIDSSMVGSTDINNIHSAFCDGSEVVSNSLSDFDDWDNLMLNSKSYSSWSDGIHVLSSVNLDPPVSSTPSGGSMGIIQLPPTSSSTGFQKYNPNSGFYNATTSSFNLDNMTLIKTPIAPQFAKIANSTMSFDYPNQTITYTGELRARLVSWYEQWGWTLIHNQRYTLAKEITMHEVREIRSERIHSIEASINSMPPAFFKNSTSDIAQLQTYLTAADNFVKSDDLYDTQQMLQVVRNYANNTIVVPPLKSQILTKITDDMDSLKTASITSVTYHQPIQHQTIDRIELDKNQYSWKDRVYITVIAPEMNTDPNLIDVIGNTNSSSVTISTAQHTLHNFKLVETGVDTGIFTGRMDLTGFNYSVTDTSTPLPSLTNGSGPTGSIQDDGNDVITVSFLHGNQEIQRAVPIKWNIGLLMWDSSKYRVGGNGIITLIDKDLDQNRNLVDIYTHLIQVRSTSDPIGTYVDVVETGPSTGVFSGSVKFTQGNSASSGILHVGSGDDVTATYSDRTLPSGYPLNTAIHVNATAHIK